MNSFQSSLKGVFGAWGSTDVLSPRRVPGQWPILKFAPPPSPEPSTKEKLARVVDREIVPRLLAANRPSSAATAPATSAVRETTRLLSVDLGAVESFTWTVLSRTADRMNEQIALLLHDGFCEEQIYFQLLAPSAHLLIELWGEDRISYVEVTVSLNRLQQVIRNFEGEVPYNGDSQSSPRSALFAPSPGGQQTFGFYVVEELFRWSGWRTWVEINTEDKDIAAKARCHWFDVACLNVTREGDIDAASATIEALRRMSRNRDLQVLAYGRLCIERPWLVTAIGADVAASDANEALKIMDQAMTRPAID